MRLRIPKSQIPSSKSQAPNDRPFNGLRAYARQGEMPPQSWNLNIGIFLEFEVWSLGFPWSLDLGAWNL